MPQLQDSAGSGRRLADGYRSTRNKLQVSKKSFESIWAIFWSKIWDRRLWLDTWSTVFVQALVLSFQPKCPISNFGSKNRLNWFERLLGPLKVVPGRSRAIGHPDWILNFRQMEVVFNSPLSIRTDLNCPQNCFVFFFLCLRICESGGT